MKLLLRSLYVTALISVVLAGCKSPLKDISLQVNGDIMHYTRVIQVTDPSGGNTDGLNVKITGEDAAAIYNLQGRKVFTIAGGFLQIGVNPYFEPTDSKPLRFNVEVTGIGYLPVTYPVTIFKNERQLILSTAILKISSPPNGVSVETPVTPLQNNAIPAAVTIGTTAENQVTEVTKITLPAGTSFFNASGAPLAGTELASTIVGVDPSKENALSLFPGGSLASENIIGVGGQVTAGVFRPASLLDLNMSVGGQSVKTFNQPINLTIQIDPTYFNATSNSAVKAGDVLSVYSYSDDTKQWKFESNVTVSTDAQGKLQVLTTTNHLTWFMVGQFTNQCSGSLKVVFSKAWTSGVNASYPITVKAYTAKATPTARDKYVVASALVDVDTITKTVTLDNLPQQNVILAFYSGGIEIASASVTDPCGAGSVPVSIPQPANLNQVTMELYVKCPTQTTLVTVLPTFYMYYKPAGSTADFQLLGVVEKGFISSLLLTAGTKYDFKAVWGDKIKTVYAYTVQQNNSTIAGPDNNLGNSVANNLALITQSCRDNGLTP